MKKQGDIASLFRNHAAKKQKFIASSFSAMSLVKTKLRNNMCDSLLDDYLVTYIERDIFFEVNEEDIIETFMVLRKRRPDK
jgi:hypothetical protein